MRYEKYDQQVHHHGMVMNHLKLLYALSTMELNRVYGQLHVP